MRHKIGHIPKNEGTNGHQRKKGKNEVKVSGGGRDSGHTQSRKDRCGLDIDPTAQRQRRGSASSGRGKDDG